jgi:predicted permease
MQVVDTVVPILSILALGAALARFGFLERRFIDELNRLVFWVGIPCFVVHSLAVAEAPASGSLGVTGALAVTTLAAVPVGFGLAALLGLERRLHGTFVQASFRGNLAFVGIPVLMYAAGGDDADLRARAVLVLAPTMLLYNSLAVVVLLSSARPAGDGAHGLRTIGREIGTNPLILSCLAGLLVSASPVPLPTSLLRALGSVGEIAVPLALLCIGATLATTRLEGRVGAAVAAAALKVAAVPLLALVAARWFSLDDEGLRILLVYAACPAASSSYIMAVKMGGDGALASAALVVSTVLSAVALSLVVALAP